MLEITLSIPDACMQFDIIYICDKPPYKAWIPATRLWVYLRRASERLLSSWASAGSSLSKRSTTGGTSSRSPSRT